jgi:hypothetical protein
MIDLTVLAVAGLLQGGLRLPLPSWPALPVVAVSLPRLAPSGPASYSAEDKSVSTWRDGTRRTLEPAPLAIAAAFLNLGRPVVARCVKLNNPWCIKRARWPGEIGGDEEGHTAFASTEAGADAAATLLRTYYVSLGRKSALDIVRRWAPAECKVGIGGLSVALAVGGLAGTLRARYLSATGGRPGGRPTVTRTKAGVSVKAPPGGRVRVSIVPLARMPSYRVPSLVSGGGEKARPPERNPAARQATRPAPAARQAGRSAPAARQAARSAYAASAREAGRAPARRAPGGRTRTASAGGEPSVAPRPPAPAPIPSFCGSEEGRIQSYASAIARALGVQPAADLKLFDEAGRPTINLLPVMVAMSAVELGYLHAGPELAEGAVERLKARLAENAAREAAREQNNLMDTGGQ